MRRIVASIDQLVKAVQDSARSDAEVVAVLTVLLGSGRVSFVRDLHEMID